MKQQKVSGILFIAFPLILQIPFTLLSINYQYPDILRESPGYILESFQKGGSGLLAMWYSYAVSILIFVAALLQYESVSGHQKRQAAMQQLGIFSASVQFIALLRWTFIVPFLSDSHTQATSAVSREWYELLFTLQHNFLGVGLGEHVGQFTLALWTLLMVRDQSSFNPLTKILGISAAVILTLGLVEHLAVVFHFSPGLFAHGALVGFIIWSLWLVAMGLQLLKARSPASTPAA